MSTSRKAHEAKERAKPWVKWLARFGYAAKGVVYMVVGGLALAAAFGSGGSSNSLSQRGALRTILEQPFGQVLLAIVAIGLFGYALWRFVMAAQDTEGDGSDAKGIVKRTGFVISGLIYLGLAVAAVGLALGSSSSGGSGGSGGGSSAQDWTARLMAQPFGRWLVGIVGAVVIAVGLYQFYRAYSAKFKEKLMLSRMSQTEETWATRVGRLGFAARGVVYAMIGWFLIQAALQSNPSQAGGLGQAFRSLESASYGPWLLAIVALGFIAYGIFALVLARYRRIYL